MRYFCTYNATINLILVWRRVFVSVLNWPYDIYFTVEFLLCWLYFMEIWGCQRLRVIGDPSIVLFFLKILIIIHYLCLEQFITFIMRQLWFSKIYFTILYWSYFEIFFILEDKISVNSVIMASRYIEGLTWSSRKNLISKWILPILMIDFLRTSPHGSAQTGHEMCVF